MKETAIVAAGVAGIQIVKLWPHQEVIDQQPTRGFATDISIVGRRLFVAEGDGGLSIWDYHENGRLVPVSRYQSKRGAIRQVETVDGRNVMLQVGGTVLEVLQVDTTGEHIRVALSGSRPGLLYGDQLLRGIIDDRFVTCFWHVSGTHWLDMQHPSGNPAFTGQQHTERYGAAGGMVAHDREILITTRGGYVLLNRGTHDSEPAPSLRRVLAGRQHLGKPTIFGERLYCSQRESGRITIVDISDIQHPKLIRELQTDGNPGRVHVINGSLVVPNGYAGLQVMDRLQ